MSDFDELMASNATGRAARAARIDAMVPDRSGLPTAAPGVPCPAFDAAEQRLSRYRHDVTISDRLEALRRLLR